jgi:hypothetical protein
MENMLALVIGLVASTLTTIVATCTVTKWMLDARIDGLDKRLGNVETNTTMILQHLLGVKSA